MMYNKLWKYIAPEMTEEIRTKANPGTDRGLTGGMLTHLARMIARSRMENPKIPEILLRMWWDGVRDGTFRWIVNYNYSEREELSEEKGGASRTVDKTEGDEVIIEKLYLW
ncbi:hypothetical protein BDZ91DRAFT_710403 [Kalaharituber pfeilii]|nr:hypothetical protein BDZ91DRAFT_710403 [Kalaharituber pfeilii]